ncbi:MAG: rod shape-determining protein MreC [Alphaproteobacteria bacterium]|nr:rod shape-determining protein MreC [Alphaproteobacteria bacterium]
MRRRRPIARSIARALPFYYHGGGLSYLILILVSIALMAISALRPQVFDSARENAADLFAPALSAISQPIQRATMFVRDVSGLAGMQAENARLTQENERLRQWYQTAMLLDSENKALRDLLNVKVEPENTFVTARILGDAGNTYVKSLLVDAGKNDGVEKGQAVMSGEGLIGRIVEGGDQSARVLLLTDMNSRVPVVVEDTLQHAVMAGTNEDKPQLIHLPQDSEIMDGARLVTSGHGGVFPPGIPVGRVTINKEGIRTVESFADISRLMYVRVVKKSDDPNLRRAIEP